MKPEELKNYKRIAFIFSFVFGPVGIFCIAISFYIYHDVFDYASYTETARGEVIEMKYGEAKDPHTKHYNYSYTPKVQFVTHEEDTVIFYSKASTRYPNAYDIGERVDVSYNPDNPRQQAEIDEFVTKWGIFLVLDGLGLLALLAAALILYSYYAAKRRST
jgi:hypothetical protein